MARRDKLKNMKMPAYEEEELDLASLEMPEEDEMDMDMEEDMMDEGPAVDMDEEEAVKMLEEMGYTVTPPADEDEEEDDFEEGQEAENITGVN